MIRVRAVRPPLAAATALVLAAGVLAGCQDRGSVVTGQPALAAPRPAVRTTPAKTVPRPVAAAPRISLGKGLLSFPGPTQAWVAAHPTDKRTPLIRSRIASQPSSLWLTGDESFGNLRQAVAQARKADRTMVLTFYNVPGRDDGLSAPSAVTLARYKTWVNRVVSTIGTTRAIVVLEPDALWFYDRLPNAAARKTRLAALSYAVERLHRYATRTRVYLDAGTSSGSVTPARMATLLARAGIKHAAGYAVDVSSYAPTKAIQAYAQAIRRALAASRTVANPRYVIDTGRNGAASWDTTWCNPTTQRLGLSPRLVRATTGLDLDLWIKAPGTSDGNCGPIGGGFGSYGGQFLPAVAYKMIKG